MINIQSLEKLIHILATNESSDVVIPSAFAELGSQYGIAGIQLDFTVGGNFFLKSGMRKHALLYRNELPMAEVCDYEKHFTTGEKGNVIFRVYADCNKKFACR